MTFAGRLAPPRLGEALEAASTPAFKLTFALLLITAALGATYIGSEDNFPEIELRDVLARGSAISAALLLGALALSVLSRTAANVALASVTLAGIFTAYLVHTGLFLPDNRVWLAVLGPGALFALFAAFRLTDDFRWGGLALTAVASLPLIALIWSQAWSMVAPGLGTPGGMLYWGNPKMWVGILGVCLGSGVALYLMTRLADPSRWGGFALLTMSAFLAVALILLDRNYSESGSGYYADGWEQHPNIQSIAFRETPNLYFVVFDSIIPEAVMQRYMEIESTDFHTVFENDMRRFRNLFANSITTVYSMNALLALDWDMFLEQWDETGSRPSFVAGHDLAPLVWIMRQNGYVASSIINTPHFGHRHGLGIDHYIINRREAICSLLEDDRRTWSFWGYCIGREVGDGQVEQIPSGDFLVREIAGIDRSNPQFVLGHLYLPGHYAKHHDRAEFLERYERNFNAAALYLERIIGHLRINDPGAMLFVLGDHGAMLSINDKLEDDPTFFLQDRFGILGGVYPPDRCSAEFDEAESKGYVTSLDVVHAILECLSEGQSPLREPRNDRFWGSGVPEDHDYRYEDFLYE